MIKNTTYLFCKIYYINYVLNKNGTLDLIYYRKKYEIPNKFETKKVYILM